MPYDGVEPHPVSDHFVIGPDANVVLGRCGSLSSRCSLWPLGIDYAPQDVFLQAGLERLSGHEVNTAPAEILKKILQAHIMVKRFSVPAELNQDGHVAGLSFLVRTNDPNTPILSTPYLPGMAILRSRSIPTGFMLYLRPA